MKIIIIGSLRTIPAKSSKPSQSWDLKSSILNFSVAFILSFHIIFSSYFFRLYFLNFLLSSNLFFKLWFEVGVAADMEAAFEIFRAFEPAQPSISHIWHWVTICHIWQRGAICRICHCCTICNLFFVVWILCPFDQGWILLASKTSGLQTKPYFKLFLMLQSSKLQALICLQCVPRGISLFFCFENNK